MIRCLCSQLKIYIWRGIHGCKVRADLPLSLEKLDIKENNDWVFSVSKAEMLLGMLFQDQPLISDIKHWTASKRCLQGFCLQNQCDEELRFVSLHEKVAEQCLDLVVVRASDSLSIICREAWTTPFNVPSDLRSSKWEILFDNLKPCRRTRSTSELGTLFTEYASVAVPGNVIFCPIEECYLDKIDRKSMVKDLVRSPLFGHVGSLDGNVSLQWENPIVKDSKCSGFLSSPSGRSISSPQKLVREIISFRKHRYGSDFTDKTKFSFSCAHSTSSFQSSTCGISSTGLLHFTWKNGLPHFMFSMDDRADVYVAHACKLDFSADKALDYIYLFHSQMDDKKEPFADNVSSLVGKMKVSSSMTLTTSNVKLMETEFILFGASEDSFVGIQNSMHTLRTNKGLPKKVVDFFRTRCPSKYRSTHKFGNPNSISRDFSCDNSPGMLANLDGLHKDNFIEKYVSNLELAAIVVKDYQLDKTQEASVGGWGLKFLKKFIVEHANSIYSSSRSCEDGSLRDQTQPTKSFNVIVPAGVHGGPKHSSGGPSSLTERWKSGGKCDCGGWDTGCRLKVLNSRSSSLDIFSETDVQEDCKAFDLFTEGAREGDRTLKMVKVHEGLFFIQFHSTLSALQSFSIGVAIIHSQCPSLRLNMYRR